MPQGSVIGPLLFILYVNDLPEVTKNSTVALFADDSKCYRAIQSPADRDPLQTDLDSMHNWSISWQLKFNVSKTLLLRVSRKRNSPTHSYHLNNQPVKIVANQVDLGVVVSNDKWSPHIVTVLLKPTVCLVFFGEIVLKLLILAAVGFYISHSSDLTCLTPVRSGQLKPRHAILRSWRVFRDELLNLYFKIMSCLILSVLGNLIYCLYLTGLK